MVRSTSNNKKSLRILNTHRISDVLRNCHEYYFQSLLLKPNFIIIFFVLSTMLSRWSSSEECWISKCQLHRYHPSWLSQWLANTQIDAHSVTIPIHHGPQKDQGNDLQSISKSNDSFSILCTLTRNHPSMVSFHELQGNHKFNSSNPRASLNYWWSVHVCGGGLPLKERPNATTTKSNRPAFIEHHKTYRSTSCWLSLE